MLGSLKISMIVSAATTLANQTHDTELHGFCFTPRDFKARRSNGTGAVLENGAVAMNSIGSM